jgi:glycine/D-amino acid oxidase-like deaminating enzyme
VSPASTLPRAVVIGGGVYGASVALYLKTRRGFGEVRLFEREAALFRRSSYVNQARVHSGYHYPRSFTTAFRSRANLPRFIRDFGAAVQRDFTKIYAIARVGSQVNSTQFERLIAKIGAPLEIAPSEISSLFSSRLIERVYICEEFGFNAAKLGEILSDRLRMSGVIIHTSHEVTSVIECHQSVKIAGVDRSSLAPFTAEADIAFNCTYSGLHAGAGNTPGNPFGLKHEIAEMALVELPSALQGLGVTVMDGPFFSIMPFPDRGLHTLSHVRYTPHFSWQEDGLRSPYQVLEDYPRQSRADRMIRDAARYLPAASALRVKESLFEVKTIPIYTEGNDGRPILLHRSPQHGRLFSILGGKIDNVYDVLERLDATDLLSGQRALV